MHSPPDHPDDLTDLERRLSSWKPASSGLDADSLLFAAGVAAGRPRLPWKIVSGVLAGMVAALGVWLAAERGERQALARQLEQLHQRPAVLVPAEPATVEEPAGNSVLASHRALKEGLDAWPTAAVVASPPVGTMPEEVLRAGQWDQGLDW